MSIAAAAVHPAALQHARSILRSARRTGTIGVGQTLRGFVEVRALDRGYEATSAGDWSAAGPLSYVAAQLAAILPVDEG